MKNVIYKTDVAPCPFCNGKVVMRDKLSIEQYWIACASTACMASGPKRKTPHAAAKAWDRLWSDFMVAPFRTVSVQVDHEGRALALAAKEKLLKDLGLAGVEK